MTLLLNDSEYALLMLSTLCQTIFSSIIAERNGLPQQQQKSISRGLEPAADELYDGKRRRIIIFSISAKVLHEEMTEWDFHAELETALAEICILPWMLPNEKSMLFFGDELVRVQRNASYSDVWLSEKEIQSECDERFTEQNYIKQDIGAKLYEPSKEYNTKFLRKVLQEIKNFSAADGRKKLHIFTNFAEKALANYLNSNPFTEFGQVDTQLSLGNVPSANYYLYALNRSEHISVWQHSYYCFYKYDKDNLCGFYSHGRTGWPQIYLFVFSSNLTFDQRNAIIKSVKTPMEMYLAKLPEEPFNILLSFHRNWFLINPSEFYYTAESLAAQFVEASRFLLMKSPLRDIDLIKRKKTCTTDLWERSLDVFYTHLLGAQLPPEMEADAINPVMHPKPRVVLITDYVEEKFINGHLPNRSIFEFKVYALNPTVYGAYEDKADLVIQLNPDEPGEIPVDRNDPEPIIRENLEKSEIVHKYLSLKILVPCVVGSALSLLIILTLFFRVRRLNWLHKLERFKTEHLYHAYQNSQKSGKKNSNTQRLKEWEMQWNQLLLNSEQLGRGVFGAVYKATLTSLPYWMAFPDADVDAAMRQKELIKSTGIRKGSQVAVKMLRSEQASEKHRLNFLKEIEIMKMLITEGGHRCVVRMLGCMSQPYGTLGLVLEYCPGGNLLEHVKQLGTNKANEEMKESHDALAKTFRQFARFGWQICDGMLFLGTKNLVHRDLAARNVLLDGEQCAKIADFGLCICLDVVKNNPEYGEENKENEAITTVALDNERLPIRWLAPECLKRRKFSQKSDIWSFGVLLHEMFTFGQNPFDGVEHKDLLEYILRNQQGGYTEKPALCPDEIYEIMQKCLTLDEEARPNFAQIQAELAAFLEKNSAEYGYLQLNEYK